MRMANQTDDRSWLYSTLSWMSPSWPIGAFAYSSGLEWAHEAGWLYDANAVAEWIRDSLDCGSLSADAACFVRCFKPLDGNAGAIEFKELATFSLAAQISRERSIETAAQGDAFRAIAINANRQVHPGKIAAYERATSSIEKGKLPYPVAAGVLFAIFRVPVEAALLAFLHAAVANLLSASQRIVPLGHTDTQVLASTLQHNVQHAVDISLERRLLPIEQALASANLAAEIACIQHETQYTRLFRT